jgi:transposase
VGLDVHKETITLAVAEEGKGDPAVLGTIRNDWTSLWKQLRRLGPKESLRCCYEAGPTGYGVYRDLRSRGIECMVVAPAPVPQQTGRRVKTDRRDAVKLARYLRSGDLTAVYVPDEVSEAIRDLVRARFDAKKAERVGRGQLFHFLLRHGLRYPGKTSWTKTHLEWIRFLRFEHEAQQRVLIDYLHVVEEAAARIQRLEDDIAEQVKGWALCPLVEALQALRGVSLVAAATVAAELGDISRFETARQLMAYVGVVPSERSSGESRRQGRITRTGNHNARWVVVEAAWSYRFSPKMSAQIRKRNEAVSAEVRQIAWKAQQRLYRKYVRLLARGKNKQQAMTAVARELLGFMWAISREPKRIAG